MNLVIATVNAHFRSQYGSRGISVVATKISLISSAGSWRLLLAHLQSESAWEAKIDWEMRIAKVRTNSRFAPYQAFPCISEVGCALPKKTRPLVNFSTASISPTELVRGTNSDALSEA